MGNRKAISKKIRFEVFKRDSFKCQYCGRSAPEVVLHVDHIKPLAEDGENSIFNYITACADCNLGKGARKLDDSTELEKQKHELDLLNERREQIEMMLEWRKELEGIKNIELEVFKDQFSDKCNRVPTESGEKTVKLMLKKYGLNTLLEAIDVVSEKSEQLYTLDYIGKVAAVLSVEKEKPFLKDLFYIRGILKNKLRDYRSAEREIMTFLEKAYKVGYSIDDLKHEAKVAEYWDNYTFHFSEARK